MNEFDEKWQIGARRARQIEPMIEAQAPFAFAARVVSQARTAITPVGSLEQVWIRFALRALAGLGVALFVVFSYGGREASNPESLLPEIVNNSTQLLWTP